MQHKTHVLLFCLLLGGSVNALEFNHQELIILKGRSAELAPDEGYLFLPVQTNTELDYLILDHVDSGKRLKFNDVSIGENHALIKLKAGQYYWKRIRKMVGYYSYSFKFEKHKYQFTVQPGVVNYAGNWMFNMDWKDDGRFSARLTVSNKMAYEWLNYRRHFAPLVKGQELVYSGQVRDDYRTYLSGLIDQQAGFQPQSLNYHGLPESPAPLTFFSSRDGVEQQTAEFPRLRTYVKSNDRSAGELSPDGLFVLLHSVVNDNYIIEVLNTRTFKSYVLFKERFHKNARISHLNWIDQDSFLYDLTFGDMTSTHVVHLNINDQQELTGAEQLEFPLEGVVIDHLPGVENTLLFANFTAQESVRNDGRGLYRVDTTDDDSLRKSFWKTLKHTRQFDHVMQWMTDHQGRLRSAIELEYDDEMERYLFHHWFNAIDADGSTAWRKIVTTHSDDDIPLPVMLSEDGQFFYALTNQYGEMQSIHKYSVEDYRYLGPFYEDRHHDITGLKLDPSTGKVTAYSYVQNGNIKLNFFNEKDDRISHLRAKNPGINLFVRQHNEATGNMLVFGTTNYSRGAWYLYNTQSGQIHKLMDINADYEALPKGDSFVVKIKAADGVMIEGYLVKPSGLKGQQAPLVVLPHGGPIGVRDYADNDEAQHFFAAHGIATLKVNYRGSSGFGKAFEEAGNGQWGEQIEKDIHQLVQHTVQQHQLNGDKICAMGGSYGGYSALMLTLLYPETYRCAVSMAGVVDLPLMFTGIGESSSDRYQQMMRKIVGDPDVDYAHLVSKSPFYQAAKLSRPVKLFHGELDDVVSLEQSLRMQQVIKLLKLDADLTILRGEAHAFKYLNSRIFYLAESLKFIQQKLGLASTAKPYEVREPDPDPVPQSVTDYLNHTLGG
jgi:acetyl esterase/lipase